MTTEIQRHSSPRLPAPSSYAQYLERVAAAAEIRRKRERQDRIICILTRVLWASIAVLIAASAYTEYLA